MGRVIWTEAARADLRGIYDWIGRDSLSAADRFVSRLIDATNRLDLLPDSGSPVEDFPTANLREVIVGDYRIIYSHRGGGCRIHAVIHGSRDLRHVLDPENLR